MSRYAQVVALNATGRAVATYTNVDAVDTSKPGHVQVRRDSPTPAVLADLTSGPMVWVYVEQPRP